MSVSLNKGGTVSLSKESSSGVLSKATVGLGWDVNSFTGADFDLDAVALLVGENGKVLSDQHFVFFNQLSDPSNSVVHKGDNRTGEGDGDDEVITVDVDLLPAECAQVVFGVSIYGDTAEQNFGNVRSSYIRVIEGFGEVGQVEGKELTRFDLGEDFSTERMVIAGSLYRHNGEWKFRAIGQGYADGLAGAARDYGVSV